MKKRLLLLLIALCVLSINAYSLGLDLIPGDVIIMGGMNLAGEQEVIDGAAETGEIDVKGGFSLGLEYLLEIPFIDFGVGALLNLGVEADGDAKDSPDGYTSMPVYGVIKAKMPIPFLTPYALLRVGQVLMLDEGDNDADPGLYYAIGVGAEFLDTLRAEILYSSDTVDADQDVDYSKLSLIVGLTVF